MSKSLTESQRREMKILNVLDDCCGDFGFATFAFLSAQTGIDRRQARVDVRRMARRGWTRYGKGLWAENGEPAGSGYAITDAGRQQLATVLAAIPRADDLSERSS